MELKHTHKININLNHILTCFYELFIRLFISLCYFTLINNWSYVDHIFNSLYLWADVRRRTETGPKNPNRACAEWRRVGESDQTFEIYLYSPVKHFGPLLFHKMSCKRSIKVPQNMEELVLCLHEIFEDDRIDVDEVRELMASYVSKEEDWRKYANYDPYR